MRSKRSLAGKVALITGGAKGLGAATAAELVSRGASVAVVDIDPPAQVHPAGAAVLSLRGNVTEIDDMREAVAAVAERFGRLDIAIANAGVAARGTTVRAADPEVVHRILDINVRGALNTVQAALSQVIENRGNIALVSSVFSYINGAGTVPYAMSKAAVEQLGRGLRVELAAFGVQATTAYFAMINTDMIRQSVDEDPTAQALLGALPRVLNKRISPQEAAGAIVDGIERGAPRVMRPRRWAAISLFRGALAVAMDAQLAGSRETRELIRDLDARAGQDSLTS